METRNQYVDLTTNGRLFPTWVLANFKKFKLPPLELGTDDVCGKEMTNDFRTYQIFLTKYLDYNSPYKDILIYHGLGVGKTASAINIYNMLYNYNSGWNVFILVKASLHSNWVGELKKWLSANEKEYRMENIKFVHYDSPFADREFFEAMRMSDTAKKNMYIIDESHLFIRNVHGNISTNKGKRAQAIYDYIIQDKRDSIQDKRVDDVPRVILISGTPAVNSPFELALLFNLLRPDSFPRSEAEFNRIFISNSLKGEMNLSAKNLFQRRILGLVSYYHGATPDYFAKQVPHYITVKMSDYQRDIYKFFAEIEAKAIQKSKGKSETYRTYTRQACNFVFPPISQRVSGEQRPRPSLFKITEREAEKLDHGKFKVDESSGKVMNLQGYKDAIALFLKSFEDFLDDLNETDIKSGHTLSDDIKTFQNKYKGEYDEFHSKEKNKSKLYEEMYKCSAKAMYMLFLMTMSKGSILIYTNYVLMEGIQLMKVYMKYFGYSQYNKKGDKLTGNDGFRYAEYHGNVEKEQRDIYKEAFNDPKNNYGKIIKVFLISPAGAEGISLLNVRQIHIFEPYWHETRIQQMIGRGIRLKSHCGLPKEERVVDVYRYVAVIDNMETSDQYIEKTARNKDRLVTAFLDAVKESAVDCQLYHEHNALQQDIKCFTFNEPSILSKQVGPAYKKDIEDDKHMNNGSNSLTSITRKVKVTKVTTVKRLNADGEEPKYSAPEKYWCNLETGTVYDLELHYAIGRIGRDQNNILLKLDKDTYIIDFMIAIPVIRQRS